MIGVPVTPHFEREHKLGTRKIDELGCISKYAKIDFGIIGTDAETGKKYRSVCYAWIVTKI